MAFQPVGEVAEWAVQDRQDLQARQGRAAAKWAEWSPQDQQGRLAPPVPQDQPAPGVALV